MKKFICTWFHFMYHRKTRTKSVANWKHEGYFDTYSHKCLRCKTRWVVKKFAPWSTGDSYD